MSAYVIVIEIGVLLQRNLIPVNSVPALWSVPNQAKLYLSCSPALSLCMHFIPWLDLTGMNFITLPFPANTFTKIYMTLWWQCEFVWLNCDVLSSNVAGGVLCVSGLRHQCWLSALVTNSRLYDIQRFLQAVQQVWTWVQPFPLPEDELWDYNEVPSQCSNQCRPRSPPIPLSLSSHWPSSACGNGNGGHPPKVVYLKLSEIYCA